MSTAAITSSLLSTTLDSSSTANQFATDLNQLTKDLQTGNLSGAQQDFVTLSQDLQNSAGSATATTSSSGITVSLLSQVAGSSTDLSTFAGELTQLGTDLTNGNLSSSQQDLLTLNSTVLNAASSTSSTTTAASTASTTSTLQRSALIRAVVQALGSGDSSAASTALSQLASVSPSQGGATALQQLSTTLGSGSSSAGSSYSQLLQNLNSNSSSSSSSSILSLLG